jgi:3-hydroxyacyl-[acyl-carrier-protein] dehydratase
MLRDSFFRIIKEEHGPGSIKAVLIINKDHAILKGHFPGQPVVPGVCMMQMVKELVEVRTNRLLRVTEADNMKFLSVIDPFQNNKIEAAVTFVDSEENIQLNATLFSGTTTFFKLKATLQTTE